MIRAGALALALSTPSSTASLNPLRKSKSDPVFCLSTQNVRCRSSAIGISSQNGVHYFKSIYGNYLSKAGIPKEIASNFETLLQTYCNFINGYTAISRAKKQVILVGSEESLHAAMTTPAEPRKSKLVTKVHQELHFAA